MNDKRPQAGQILLAQMTGEARRLARWRELTVEAKATAVAELRELAAGRADLLAAALRHLVRWIHLTARSLPSRQTSGS